MGLIVRVHAQASTCAPLLLAHQPAPTDLFVHLDQPTLHRSCALRPYFPCCRWHLWEHHVLVDGKAVPGAIFDFALYFFHNAHLLLKKGNGPYFYLVSDRVR